ncbi:unnamed protein product, partial [Gulo gulo]
ADAAEPAGLGCVQTALFLRSVPGRLGKRRVRAFPRTAGTFGRGYPFLWKCEPRFGSERPAWARGGKGAGCPHSPRSHGVVPPRERRNWASSSVLED